jgi:hypothetical protein
MDPLRRSLMPKKIGYFFILVMGFLLQPMYAAIKLDNRDNLSILTKHPFYIGLTSGYGSTTWGQLVPPSGKSNAAINISVPIKVHEGGVIWGFFAGYELMPTFAIEGSYTRYRIAEVFSDPYSNYALDNGRLSFTTQTESASLVGKFMLIIPHTTLLRAFSSVGAAVVHRNDLLNNRYRVSPTFGVGFNYNFTEHVMAEAGINYTGGYGQSELEPLNDYIPFLYSGFVRLAYRFG